MKSPARFRNLCALLMAFLLSFQLFAVVGHATDAVVGEPETPVVPEFVGFTDVFQEDAWHDDIYDLYDAGILFGIGDGRFAPYQAVTARQVLVTYARMMKIDASDSDALVQNAKAGRTLASFVDPDGPMTRAQAVVLLFKCLGALPSLEPDWDKNLNPDIDEYEDPIYTTDRAFRFVFDITDELGLLNFDPSHGELFMSRGEYSMILNVCRKLLIQDPNSPITKLGFGYFPVTATENFSGKIAGLWGHVINIPYEVLKVYHKSGYTVLLDDAYIKAGIAEGKFQAANIVGLFSSSNKCIFATESHSIVHEIGHFVQTFMAGQDDIVSLYKAESKYAKDLLGAYSASSEKEYFAEVFAYFVKNRGDSIAMNLLDSLAPETYRYFVNLAANGYLKPGNTELLSNNFES